jgi:hypothetical protein
MESVFVGTTHIITSLGFSMSDHYRQYHGFIVEQKNNIEPLKKPLKYIIFKPLSVKKLFKGNPKSWKR